MITSIHISLASYQYSVKQCSVEQCSVERYNGQKHAYIPQIPKTQYFISYLAFKFVYSYLKLPHVITLRVHHSYEMDPASAVEAGARLGSDMHTCSAPPSWKVRRPEQENVHVT